MSNLIKINRKNVIKSMIMVSLFAFVFTFVALQSKASSDEVYAYTRDSFGNEGVIMKSELPNVERDTNYTDYYIPDGVNIDSSFLGLTSNLNGSRGIIGGDDREVLEDSQYSLFPYCTVCKIHASYGNGAFEDYGTGYLVGPRTVLTACQNVIYCGTQYNYTWADVTIGFGEHKNSNEQIVYEYGLVSNITMITCGSFHDTGNANDDWALIDLGVDVGYTLGYIGVADLLYNNDTLNCIAYSSDNKYRLSHAGGTATHVYTYNFEHTCDCKRGASGAPVMKGFFGVGIESLEHYNYALYPDYNIACKISSYIVSWIDERLDNDDD